MTTGSQFCCDEHAEQHKTETVGRLLEYHQESAGYALEDPIHRLASFGAAEILHQEEQREWQLQLHVWIEPRRFSPAKMRLHSVPWGEALLSPRLHFPPLPAPRLVWNPAAVSVPRPAAQPATKPPEQEPPRPRPMLENPAPAVWLWPSMHSTQAAGYRPEASASRILALRGQRVVVVPAHLRPAQPARMASAARLPRLDLAPQKIVEPAGARLSAMPQLVRVPSAILTPGASGARLRSSGWRGVQPAQHFIPVAVPVAAQSATLAALAYAEIQSVAPVEWSAAPACESITFAEIQKQPAPFSPLAPAAQWLEPQPWRPAEIESQLDRPGRRFWLPGPPPPRRWNGFASRPAPVQPAAQPAVLAPAVSADLLVAALSLAPAVHAPQAGPLAAQHLPWSAGAPQAPPAPLAPCCSRYALRPAAPTIMANAPGAACAAQRLAPPAQLYPGAPAAPRSPWCPPAQLSRISPAISLARVQTVFQGCRAIAAASLAPRPPRPRPPAPVMPEGALFPRSLGADHRFRRAVPETDLPKTTGQTFEAGGWISLHSAASAGQARPLRPSAKPAAPLASAHLPMRSGLRAYPVRLSLRPAQEPARPAATPAMRPSARARWRDALPHPVVAAPVGSGRWVAPQKLGGSFGARGARLFSCLPSLRDAKPAPFAAFSLRAPKPQAQNAAVARPVPITLTALEPEAAPLRPLAAGPARSPEEGAPEFHRPAPAIAREALAMSLPTTRPATPTLGPEPLKAPPLRTPPPEPLQPVERIEVAAEPLPPKPATPAPKTLAEDQAGVREALEQMQRARAGSSVLWFRRRKAMASLWWVEVGKPALQSKHGRAFLTAITFLLSLVLVLHVAKSPVSMGVRAVTKPLRERAYFLLEDTFQSAAAWSNPALLQRREDGLVECKDGVTLYQPSLSRVDYEFTFDGLVRRTALDWVVRAADSKNYYAFKLMRLGKGKDRRTVLIRYPVVNGATTATEKHVTAMPFDLEENKMYHIVVQVFGDRITTLIDERGVDSFSQSDFKLGGVGLFSEAGESALVRSISISGNDDGEGRMIAWLKGFLEYLGGQV